MSLERVREAYGVPARRGMRIRYRGDPCIVVGATKTNLLLRVRFPEDSTSSVIHPTVGVEYPEVVT